MRQAIQELENELRKERQRADRAERAAQEVEARGYKVSSLLRHAVLSQGGDEGRGRATSAEQGTGSAAG